VDGPTDLLRYGDIAMYRAKEREGTTYHVFDARSDSEATRRLHHENELREALDLDQLRVHYQPIVALESGEIRGAEALVRWEHPERGVLKPTDFIPLAEETGLIVPLGDWILRETTRQVSAWKKRFAAPEGFSLSVNLSPYQFREPDLLRQAARVLKQSGLSPHDLQLEITESMVIQGKAKIEELADLGLRVAIDDFGTGYSSLNYLKRLKVDSLKIDRSFVDGLGRDEDDDAIVRTILLLAERLELEVIAEGVETREQLQHLVDVGCELGQGYYFARPVDAPEFEGLLRRNREDRPPMPSAAGDSVETQG
ncbi:MAG: putative bifunctional diguanylate cyclase/phosphodiesterase, partial [Gemmatimonadota bacterium]